MPTHEVPERAHELGDVLATTSSMTGSSMTGARVPSSARRLAIFGVKTLHTVIFAIEAVSVVHLFVAGVFDRPSRWTRLALVATLSEVGLMVLTRWHCPLTSLAERLGAESGRVSDIFLPRWFADRIPQIFTPLLFAGLAGLAWRRLRRAGALEAGD